MIVKHGSFMDTSLIRDLGKKLVSGQIGVLFRKSHVIPGDVFCLENITGFHIRIRKSHGRKMITEHNNDGIFTAAVNSSDQVTDEIIYFMDHIYIIFPLIV